MKLGSYAVCFASVLLVPAASTAQVVLDGTLDATHAGVAVPAGTDSAGEPATYLIGEEFGRREAGNLFHSFSRFDVSRGETATFDGPSAPDRVIARVTGHEPSEIAGTLRSNYAGADVFLVNPAGVTFAEGARLDVPASFHVSTADYVKLGTDGRFDAADPSRDVLSMAPPSAFGFLGAPAGVTVEAKARVRLNTQQGGDPAALSIVAGDVTVAGDLGSLRGDLDIVSVASAGEVDSALPEDARARFPEMGTLRVTGLLNAEQSSDTPANLRIRAGRFEVDDGKVLARVVTDGDGGRLDVGADDVVLRNGGSLEARNGGGGSAPRIDVEAARVSIVGRTGDRDSRIDGSSRGSSRASDIHVHASESVTIRTGNENGGIFANASRTADGDGGSISIETPHLELGEKSRISAETDDDGDAGSIAIAVDRMEITGGADVRTGVGPDGRGRPGDITVSARDTVRIAGRIAREGAPYQTPSSLQAEANRQGGATIRVAAGRLVLDDGEIRASTRGAGDATNVVLDVGTLELVHGGRIDSHTDGAGHGGNVTVNARERVALAGIGGIGTALISEIAANTTGPGAAGTISITAPVLHLSDRAEISAYTAENPDGSGNVDPSTIPGAGGEIRFDVGDLLLESDGLVQTSSSWAGDAGSITVHASRSVVIRDDAAKLADIDQNEAGLQSRAFASGNAGRIAIATPLLQMDGGRIETSASRLFPPESGRAGDIDIRAGRVELGGWGTIRSVSETAGDAGAITVVASDAVSIAGSGALGIRAGISTDTLAAGAGGTIDVEAPQIRVARAGEIAARSSGSGDGGAIRLRGDAVEIADGGTVSAASTGSGDAGDVSIEARAMLVSGGSLATNAASADGGNVTLLLVDELRMLDGEITASVRDGRGGNVTIDPHLVFLDRSRILAEAAEGQGGAIRIVADFYFATDSVVSASAGPAGIDGTVAIESPDVDVTDDLESLPSAFLDPAALLRERCAARGGARASLYITGAPAAVAPVDGWLSAPVAARKALAPVAATASAARPVVVLSCSGSPPA